MDDRAAAPDYPQMAAARGRVEPAPRRVRGYLGNELVFDTTSARYVWEVPYYPQYYVPLSDVDQKFLRRRRPSAEGAVRTVADVLAGRGRSDARIGRTGVRRRATGPSPGWCEFEWEHLTWFEEDEPIYGHPRNPYARVDALRSHRHVTVELDGVTLADTRSPVLLFETGLPTRYYIDKTDIAFEHLEPSDTETLCPYKGVTSEYWSVRVGDEVHPDLAWTLPLPAASRRADRGHGGVLQREARHHRRRHETRASPLAVQLKSARNVNSAPRFPILPLRGARG